MTIAYFDCLSGISGDMTLGALIDAGVELDALNDAIASLKLPGCRITSKTVKKHGYRATQAVVEYEPEHVHRRLSDILSLLEGSRLTPRQRERAEAVFRRLAEAEAKVHGVTIDEIHFHEVGAADSIADIVGSVVGLDLLGVDRIVASPVPTGTGTTKIAHGVCGIPAPATAELLRGVPLAESSIEMELTTPTGAAILAALGDGFGSIPAMTVERIGIGAGQRDIPSQPNVLRLLIGRASAAAAEDVVCILETNIDDLSGEMIGHCIERLWTADVLDVWSSPIQMKKQRPGVMLSVLCREEEADSVEMILFEETTTLGVRRRQAARRVLSRREEHVETPWGTVVGKTAVLPDGTPRFAPEYESCREVAQRAGVACRDVYDAAKRAFDRS